MKTKHKDNNLRIAIDLQQIGRLRFELSIHSGSVTEQSEVRQQLHGSLFTLLHEVRRLRPSRIVLASVNGLAESLASERERVRKIAGIAFTMLSLALPRCQLEMEFASVK